MTASVVVRYTFPAALAGFLLLAACPLAAQTSGAAAASAPVSQSAAPAEGTPIEALVIEVKGRAQHAPVGTAVTDAQAWQPVQLDDRYSAGTLIRTGLSSRVVLQFGSEEPYTVVMVERMTLANIASLYRTSTEKVSHVAVDYGAVRGGVSEGGLRSSFVVDSTVATLTKRGTWGFRMFVERGTGRFTISLAEPGMIEALNRLTHRQQDIFPGQYVTQAMIRWVDQAAFDNLISMQDLLGLTVDEFQFKAFNPTGLGVLEPVPTANSLNAARPGWEQFVSQQILHNEVSRLERLQRLINILNPPRPGVIPRPEGDFNGSFR
jgi:hypothetical protein